MSIDYERIEAMLCATADESKFCQVYPKVMALLGEISALLEASLPPKYEIPVSIALSTVESVLKDAHEALCANGSSKPHPIEQPESLWSGYFAFQNFLGGKIVSGTAKHWTADWGTEELPLDGLGTGDQSLSVPFKTSTSNIDHWAFTATLEDGTTYCVKNKHCGFESEDAGKTVVLQPVVAQTSKTFNVIMPESSSCNSGFDNNC